MTAKEKATTIVKKFKGFEMPNEEIASAQCAIIHVKGIIEELEKLIEKCKLLGMWSYCDFMAHYEEIKFYQEVLTELNQM